MLFRRTKLMCPFCFEKFNSKSILFRCANDKCPVENDPVLAAYNQQDKCDALPVISPKNARVYYKKGLPWKAICPKCNRETTTKICPRCHNQLPPGFGEGETFSIAIIGGPGVGKSNYIGVSFRELNSKVLPKFGCNLSIKGEYSRKRFSEKYTGPLFDNKDQARCPLKNHIEETDVKNPLFFRIDFPKRKKYWIKTIIPGVTLDFFDTAGDILLNVDKTSFLAKYIGYADALIIVLDPLQSSTIRQELVSLDISEKRLGDNNDQQQMFNAIIQLYRDVNGLSQESPIKIPVAVAFSKTDVLRMIMPDRSIIFKDSSYQDRTINLKDIDQVDEEIRGLMQSPSAWDLEALYIAVNALSNYKLFAFSALGDMPDESNILHRGVKGTRVADPIMWLLYKKGLIKQVKN